MRSRFPCSAALLALGLCLPAAGLASTARLAGMDLSPDYVNDPTGMFSYLSTLVTTGNTVTLETGSFTGATGNGDRAMGAVLADPGGGHSGVWALHLRQLNPALGQSWLGLPINPGFLGYDPNARDESLDLMWGRRFGGVSAAARFQRSFNSSDAGASETEGLSPTRRNVTGVGIGLGFDVRRGLPVEISGQLQGRSFRSPTQVDDGGSAYLVAARAHSKPVAGVECIPVVKFYRLNLPWITLGSPARNVVNLSGWQVGGAANWAIGSGDLLVLGVRASANTLDLGATRATETLAPTIFAALETSLNPWLTLRAGARSTARLSLEQRAGAAITRAQGSGFSFSMGTTVRLGGLSFDAVLDPAFLNNPFAQLLGSDAVAFSGWTPSGGGTRAGDARRANGTGPGVAFPMVSVTYAW